MRSIITQKRFLASIAISVFAFVGLSMASPVYAAPLQIAPTATFAAADPCADVTDPNKAADALHTAEKSNNGITCIVKRYVNPFVKFMSAMAGVAVVISVVVGAIQYSSAGGDPGKVAAARGRITKAIIALLAFIFLYAFINWLLPGGVNG